MRKVVLSLVFFLAAIVVFGQKRITYGINVGSGVSFLTGTNNGLVTYTAPKADITVGVSADVRIWRSWYFQAELNYQNIGGGKDGDIVVQMPMAGYDKYIFQYMSIPMLIRYKIPRRGLAFYAGFQYAYLLSGNVKTGAVPPTTLSGGQQEPNSTYSAQYVRNGDFSGVGGVEYFWHLKKGTQTGVSKGTQIGVSARYQWSLPTIDDDGNAATTLKNRVFLLTVGYRF